jgi:hypothetical protein
MNGYNTFDYDGILAIAFKNTPELNEALLGGNFKEVHEKIQVFVRRVKEVEIEDVMPTILAVMSVEPPPLLLPDRTRLCDRCDEALPALAHGRRKRHNACR